MCISFGVVIITCVLKIINLLIGLCGGIIILLAIFGIYTGPDLPDYVAISHLGNTVTAAGIILVSISAFGCVSLMWKNHIMLMIYSVLIVGVIAIQLIVVTVAGAKRSDFLDAQENALLDLYNKGGDTGAIFLVETSFQCCGPNGPEFYEKQTIPVSCCEIQWDCKIETAHTTGCIEATQKLVNQIIDVNGIIQISFLIIETVGLSFVCCLSHYYKDGTVPMVAMF